MEIKDSGQRREFESGAVRDMAEKGRCDLMPWDELLMIMASENYIGYCPNDKGNLAELSFIYAFQRTGDIQKLVNSARFFITRNWETDESAMLDLAKHFEQGAIKYGERNWQKGIPTWCYIDSAIRHWLKHERGDDDEPHDRAFLWNIACCMWTVNNLPELNSYRKEDEK